MLQLGQEMFQIDNGKFLMSVSKCKPKWKLISVYVLIFHTFRKYPDIYNSNICNLMQEMALTKDLAETLEIYFSSHW